MPDERHEQLTDIRVALLKQDGAWEALTRAAPQKGWAPAYAQATARYGAALERVTVLERALERAQGEAYISAQVGGPEPLDALQTIMSICAGALDA
jgi:hypothetical protein